MSLPQWGHYLVLLANIRIGLEWLAMTNTPAYCNFKSPSINATVIVMLVIYYKSIIIFRYKGRLLAWPPHSRIGLKLLTVTNRLAYYIQQGSIAWVNSCTVQALAEIIGTSYHLQKIRACIQNFFYGHLKTNLWKRVENDKKYLELLWLIVRMLRLPYQ
jgi:hypothetical protein